MQQRRLTYHARIVAVVFGFTLVMSQPVLAYYSAGSSSKPFSRSVDIKVVRLAGLPTAISGLLTTHQRLAPTQYPDLFEYSFLHFSDGRLSINLADAQHSDTAFIAQYLVALSNQQTVVFEGNDVSVWFWGFGGTFRVLEKIRY